MGHLKNNSPGGAGLVGAEISRFFSPLPTFFF